MSGPVDRQHLLGIDGGVPLGGRQRGVAEQLLDRAQVAAASEQVGGEAMPQPPARTSPARPERGE